MKIELSVGLPTSKASSYKSSCSLGVAIHERYQLPDGTYRFVTELSDAVLLLKKEGTGLERYMPESELAEMLGKGTATRLREPRNKDGKPIKLVSGDELAPDELRTKRGIRAQALWEGVREFDSDPKATKGAKGLREVIKRTQIKLQEKGIEYQISPTRLLWAINSCGSPGDRRLRYFLSQRGKIKRSRLPENVENFLAATVSFFWDKRTRDFNDATAYFAALCSAENERRAEMGLKPLRAPKRTETIRRRITLATNHANWAKKYGTHSADQKFRGVSDHLSATRPGELVLIDHTLMDTYLLLDRRTGLPLGRPWLSMAIDVATRCILGFLVTPEPPSLNTLVTLLKRINRDKTFLAEKYPHVEGHTDSWILPTTVLLDNDWSHLSPSAQRPGRLCGPRHGGHLRSGCHAAVQGNHRAIIPHVQYNAVP